MSKVSVIGGGLAGLCAAAMIAHSGSEVVLHEKGKLGGRARSKTKDGFVLNQGPHALYRAGAARRVLDGLGIAFSGAAPTAQAMGLVGERIDPLPFAPWAALSTEMLTPRERWEMMRWFASFAVLDSKTLRGTSVTEWLSSCSIPVAGAAGAAIRVATYCSAFEQLDAGAAAAQLQLAMRGVDYLDGGWQTLVDEARRVAVDAGVTIREGSVVRSLSEVEGADAVLLCVSPTAAATLTGSAALKQVAERAVMVRAAVLDIGLRGELDAHRRFALGVDRPIYVGDHSSVAKLAASGTLIHAALYGGGENADTCRGELEAIMDRWIEDWRDRCVMKRWLPKMVVAWDMPRAQVRGERAPVAVPDCPRIYVAGDWVGNEGMLADAALASAEAAARAIVVAVTNRETA